MHLKLVEGPPADEPEGVLSTLTDLADAVTVNVSAFIAKAITKKDKFPPQENMNLVMLDFCFMW